MRATAKLHLLSPALFPLPFGASCLRVKPPAAEAGKDGSEAASQTAATSADVRVPLVRAINSKKAKQAKQDVSNSEHTAAPATTLPMSEPAHLPGSHLQQTASEADLPRRPRGQLTADGCGGKGLLEPAGSKTGKAMLPQAAVKRGKALVVGPVTRISGGSTGLSVVAGVASEPEPLPLGIHFS